jgi:hypothetical protein
MTSQSGCPGHAELVALGIQLDDVTQHAAVLVAVELLPAAVAP